LLRDDVEITAENVLGLSVASDGALTVALDITLNEVLIQEGIARELVSRIQTLRKERGFEVTDRILLHIQRNGNAQFEEAVERHSGYITAETLALTADQQLLKDTLEGVSGGVQELDLEEGLSCRIALSRVVR